MNSRQTEKLRKRIVIMLEIYASGRNGIGAHSISKATGIHRQVIKEAVRELRDNGKVESVLLTTREGLLYRRRSV